MVCAASTASTMNVVVGGAVAALLARGVFHAVRGPDPANVQEAAGDEEQDMRQHAMHWEEQGSGEEEEEDEEEEEEEEEDEEEDEEDEEEDEEEDDEDGEVCEWAWGDVNNGHVMQLRREIMDSLGVIGRRAPNSDLNVLLIGKSGVGKSCLNNTLRNALAPASRSLYSHYVHVWVDEGTAGRRCTVVLKKVTYPTPEGVPNIVLWDTCGYEPGARDVTGATLQGLLREGYDFRRSLLENQQAGLVRAAGECTAGHRMHVVLVLAPLSRAGHTDADRAFLRSWGARLRGYMVRVVGTKVDECDAALDRIHQLLGDTARDERSVMGWCRAEREAVGRIMGKPSGQVMPVASYCDDDHHRIAVKEMLALKVLHSACCALAAGDVL